MNEPLTPHFTQAPSSPLNNLLARRPALAAAAAWWLVFLVLAVITLFTGWASRPMTLFLQLLASLGAGVLAGWLYRRSDPQGQRYARQGALAGFYLPVASAAVMLALAVIVAIGSLGAVLPLMVPYILFLPIEIGSCSLSGAFGAWIYHKLFVR